MIVNPKEFNYRITIAILAVVITVFTAYGLVSYSTLKSDKDFLVQEKRNLHNELSEILNRYDALSSENISLKTQLDSTIYKVGVTSHAIEKLEAKSTFNAALKRQLNFLKKQKRSLQAREDSLIKITKNIKEEKQRILQELNLEKQNAYKEKETFKKKLERASEISANSFIAKAYKVNTFKKSIQTNTAREVDQIELCFVIAQNVISPKGSRDLYVQIIDPNNNVLSDKGSVSFGDESLIYSYKESVNYLNSAMKVCASIENDEPFIPGLYYINVFDNNRRLGGTEIELE
jgi:hypothetical protein